MQREQIQSALAPVLADVLERAQVVDKFVDRDLYQINLATLWANIVMNPGDVGIDETQLEEVYDVLNDEVHQVLGAQTDLKACFRYLNTKPGERAMQAARLNQTHKDMLLYFASMILDPDGHRRWMDEVKDKG